MTNLKSLLNVPVDFEMDLYSEVMNKLQNDGLCFVFDKDSKESVYLNTILEKPLNFGNLYEGRGIFFFMSKKNDEIRRNVITPFYCELFYKDDVIVVNKKESNKFVFKLIEKSTTRKIYEQQMFDSMTYISNCIQDFWWAVENMSKSDKLTHSDVRLLKVLGILENTEISYGYYKKERKEIKTNCQEKIEKLLIDRPSIQFQSVQEYHSFSKGYSGVYSSWKKQYDFNIKFWTNEEISIDEYHDKWMGL